MNDTPVDIHQIKFDLYCRDTAIRLAAANLIDFILDDSGEPIPHIWAGGAIAEEYLADPQDSWVEIEWEDMLTVAQLYNQFEELGIHFWAAYRAQATLDKLQQPLLDAYADIMKYVQTLNTRQ